VHNPPSVITFDHLSTKKRKTNASSNTRTAEAHDRNSPLGIPLSDISGQRRINTSESPAPESNTIPDDDIAYYPSISEVLRELDTTMPMANIPTYELDLNQHGIYCLEDTTTLNSQFLTDEVGMPPDLVWPFVTTWITALFDEISPYFANVLSDALCLLMHLMLCNNVSPVALGS